MHTSFKKTVAALGTAALLLGPMAVFAAPEGPTVTLTSSAAMTASTPTNITWQDPIPFSVTISSSTADFDAADIQVVGGSVVDFSGSGTSYTFSVNPGDGDPMHDTQARYVQVQINENQFSDNQASQSVSFWFDPTAAPVDATAPVITFADPSPSDGATITTASDTATTTGFTFAWSVDDASSTVMCSIVGAADADSFYACGSPQTFTDFGLGTYRFTVQATDTASNMASSSRTFTIATGTAPAPEPTPTPAPSGGSSAPSSGNGMIVGSGPNAPQAAGGPNWGVNQNPMIPQVPTAASPSPDVYVAPTTPAPAPTVSTPATPVRSVSGTAPRNTTVAAVTTPAPEETVTAPAPLETPAATPAPTENLQGAAAATAPDVPAAVWVWSLIGIAAIATLGWLFYRPA